MSEAVAKAENSSPEDAPPKPVPTRPKSWWRLLVVGFLRSIVLLAIGLFFVQHKLIYFPMRYEQEDFLGLPDTAVQLPFETSAGRQVAFYIPPREGGEPTVVWAVHSGNGGNALSWRFMVKRYPDTTTGFLLVDYPGYGYSEGSPNPKRILEGSEGAVAALATHLNMEPDILQSRVAVLGHSLGAAASLQYAAKNSVRAAVLIAPFTTMTAMARRKVGWPLAEVLLHRFDNVSRLRELAAQPNPPQVVIIHGSGDQIIPVAMGRTLGAMPGVRYIEVEKGTHDMILDNSQKLIFSTMMSATLPPSGS